MDEGPVVRYDLLNYLLDHPGLILLIVLCIVGAVALSMLTPIWVEGYRRRHEDMQKQ